MGGLWAWGIKALGSRASECFLAYGSGFGIEVWGGGGGRGLGVFPTPEGLKSIFGFGDFCWRSAAARVLKPPSRFLARETITNFQNPTPKRNMFAGMRNLLLNPILGTMKGARRSPRGTAKLPRRKSRRRFWGSAMDTFCG